MLAKPLLRFSHILAWCTAALGLWAPIGSFASARAAGPLIPQKVRASIDARIENRMAPAIVVGLVNPDGVTWYCRGASTYDGKTEVGPATLFEIGSITKAFTGILLADAVERGEVKLDDPIEKYLPENVKCPTRGGKHITLLSLAQQRSGLPRLPTNIDTSSDPANPYRDYDAKRLFAFLSEYTLERDIGAQYEYSNLGMGLLGHLLSRAANKPYAQLIVDRISKPLGMKDTMITLSAERKARFVPGHDGPKQVHAWDFDALAGCGALRSTGQDMIEFMRANLGIKKTPLAPALARSIAPRAATKTPDMKIALAWHISKKHGTEIIWHNGGTGGFRSFCGFAPSKKLGVVVLTNSTESADDIGLNLLEPKFKLRKIEKSIKVPHDVLASYVGYYEMAPGTVLHITLEGDALYAQLTGQGSIPVYPKSETEFEYRVVPASLTFARDGDGKATSVTLHQNGRDMPAKRLGDDYQPPEPRKEIAVAADVLKTYVGRYELQPSVIFDVKLEGTQLTAQITGQPRVPVYPESKSKFFYKIVDAQITFVQDEKGHVNRLILHQFGRDQTAKRLPD